MVTKKLVRVRQLIALTASSEDNEARAAAYQACRIIREEGFVVLDNPEKPEARDIRRGACPPEHSPAAAAREGAGTYVSSPFRSSSEDVDAAFRSSLEEMFRNMGIDPFAGRRSGADAWTSKKTDRKRVCINCGIYVAPGVSGWSSVLTGNFRCASCGAP